MTDWAESSKQHPDSYGRMPKEKRQKRQKRRGDGYGQNPVKSSPLETAKLIRDAYAEGVANERSRQHEALRDLARRWYATSGDAGFKYAAAELLDLLDQS